MSRDKYEIVECLLELCETPQRKTHLMYKANLSYRQTERYLLLLKKRELIESTEDLYVITDFGELFLEGLSTLIDLWNGEVKE